MDHIQSLINHIIDLVQHCKNIWLLTDTKQIIKIAREQRILDILLHLLLIVDVVQLRATILR